jgi:hypothetical protein
MLTRLVSQRLIRAGAVTALAIIIGMSIVPGGHRPTMDVGGLLIGALGVIEHIVGYAVCGSLFALGYTHWRASLIFVALAGLASGLEVVQIFVPDRTPKISDAIFSAAGAGLGIGAALWLRPYWTKYLYNKTV